MCKIYGYCRYIVSEKLTKLDIEYQKNLFKNSGIEFDKIYEELISSRNKINESQKFNEFFALLRPSDIVVFADISCIGNNYIECLEIIDKILQEKEATIRFLSNGMELQSNSTLTPYQWLTISNLIIIEEFNKRRISNSTKNALAIRKENGIILGRPNKSNQLRDKIIELSKQGKKGYEIASVLQTSPATVSRILNDILKKEITDEQRESIISLYNSHSTKEIADKMNINESKIIKILKEYGIDTTFRETQKQAIINDYLSGNTDLNFLAQKHSCNIDIVELYINELDHLSKPNIKNMELVMAIKDMNNSGETISQIAKKFNLSRQRVSLLKKQIEKYDI